MYTPFTLLIKFLNFRMIHDNEHAIFIAFVLWWFCVFLCLWFIPHPIPIWKTGITERIYVLRMYVLINVRRCVYVLIYIFTYICMSVRMYVRIYIRRCVYLFTYLLTYVCLYVCTYVFIYVSVCIYLRIYLHMYVCTYVRGYVCVYIYIYTRTYVFRYVCIYVCRCVCICMYVRKYVRTYACTHVRMYTYVTMLYSLGHKCRNFRRKLK